MDAGEVSIVLEELSYFEAVLRMLCAMLVGIIVGVERGRNHRPAGMRTHMLVALGVCYHGGQQLPVCQVPTAGRNP